jgi:hypothetical protein
MVEHFESISAQICERVLREEHGVLSLIRLVDIFFVPETRAEDLSISFFVVVLAKLKSDFIPTPKSKFSVYLIRVNGERQLITEEEAVEPVPTPFPAPVGIGLVVQMAVTVRNLGTCYVEVEFAGQRIAKIPFTLALAPSAPAPQR